MKRPIFICIEDYVVRPILQGNEKLHCQTGIEFVENKLCATSII